MKEGTLMLFRVLVAGFIAFAAACSQAPSPPNPFPDDMRAQFMDEDCSAGGEFCTCSWDRITREFTADEWEEARAKLEVTGHPDPRIVIISSQCREETR
jgi:hypothetical protein